MLAYPQMLCGAAEKAGIAVPPDVEEYDADQFPYWFVFSQMQLGAAMPWPGCHWENAQVVAAIPAEDIRSITPAMLVERGFAVDFPIP